MHIEAALAQDRVAFLEARLLESSSDVVESDHSQVDGMVARRDFQDKGYEILPKSRGAGDGADQTDKVEGKGRRFHAAPSTKATSRVASGHAI